MRRSIIIAALTLTLAGTASAAEPRGTREPSIRDRETALSRIVRIIKRILPITGTSAPTVPIP